MQSIELVNTCEIGQGKGFKVRTVSDKVPILSADKTLIDNGRRIRKIGVSLCSGCPVGCIYCFTRTFNHFRPLKSIEIIDQVKMIINSEGISYDASTETKVSFKQMGDPLANPLPTLSAILAIHHLFPSFTFVVSSSGPRQDVDFFKYLNDVASRGINIRLQFSCHTTSDTERAMLSPELPMMSYSEISDIIKNWDFSKVTLNFVLMDGYEYDVSKIAKHFNPERVFIKINYIDTNSQTKKWNIKNADSIIVHAFQNDLKKYGFSSAWRY